MSSYRFCRTDDIGLLVDALNRCWLPYFPDEGPVTPAGFKRSIRDLQVWCSSCMVAFAGSDPIGVLIGAKRPSGTLIHRIAVHPDHRRQGHGRHLLASLGSKLAILGPPRMAAEVPETFTSACELFSACGYVEEARLNDYLWESGVRESGACSDPSTSSASSRAESRDERAPQSGASRWVIPATVDDLGANGLLGGADPHVCWERSVETLTARRDDIAGIAVASEDRIDAYVLYVKNEVGPDGSVPPASATAEIVALRSLVDDSGACLGQLLARLSARGIGTMRFPKVHPAEISREILEMLGFQASGGHRLYAATAQSE